MPKSYCQIENIEFGRAGHAGARWPYDAVAAGLVPCSWGIQQRRPCEVAKKRSMDLRDTRHPDHLIGAACKQPRGQLGVVWASYTYIQGCRTLCGGTSGLQTPSVERSEAANAAAHAVEHTWATEGAGKRAPSSSRSARIVHKHGRQEEDAISGGRVDFTCARKSKCHLWRLWAPPKKLGVRFEIYASDRSPNFRHAPDRYIRDWYTCGVCVYKV